MPAPSSWLCLLTISTCVALLSGCDRSGRVAIEGTVTLNGNPLEKGYVRFQPQAGTSSPSAGAEITMGKFSVAPQGGLLPGTFRVEITASRPTGQEVRTRFSSQPVVLEEQIIPAKYNKNSQLEITISPDGRKITQVFELTDSAR